MKNLLFYFLIILFCIATARAVYAQTTPPGQPSSGYGSDENYITDTYTTYESGIKAEGTQLFYYIPAVLRNGTTAPVVIFLHGMFVEDPPVAGNKYAGHIIHLLRQGYIVIYPQFNTGNDLDQNVMLNRCITSTNGALTAIGSQAETDNMVLYGHSVGGLFCICWAGAGGVPVKALVTAHANMYPCVGGMPAVVCEMLTLLDYESLAPAVTYPAIILWGDADTGASALAPWNQQVDAFNSLINSPGKVVYTVQSDYYGAPALVGHHGAPSDPVDGVDYRYYWAALDAALDDQISLTFDMGSWGDGKPVKPVIENFAPSAGCAIEATICSEPCEMSITVLSYTCQGTPTVASLSDVDCDGISEECPVLPDGCTPAYLNDSCDNCPVAFNPGQEDTDNNGVGDACETVLISLDSLTATAKPGKVIVAWITVSEVNNAGFNIYRSVMKNGNYKKINPDLITAEGTPTAGAAYRYVDKDVKNRNTYFYKLEDVDVNGVSTMHGPVLVTPRCIY